MRKQFRKVDSLLFYDVRPDRSWHALKQIIIGLEVIDSKGSYDSRWPECKIIFRLAKEYEYFCIGCEL